ncbi:MAG: hypothetical protein KKB70_08775 [Proteobacteria bacterium]|nr:hypothetical protein [Pseudomonadota bacterium]MBU1610359.1 hypothetical protein [Pseudomonadota bacterium]
MKTQVELVRLERSEEGVFGVLRIGKRLQCMTLEPPDKGNRPDVSCIPPGRYRCRKRATKRFGLTFEVREVPNRSDILFHAGNVATDSRGCILLGERLGAIDGRRALLDSRGAVVAFREALQEEEGFELSIVERYTQRADPSSPVGQGEQ